MASIWVDGSRHLALAMVPYGTLPWAQDWSPDRGCDRKESLIKQALVPIYHKILVTRRMGLRILCICMEENRHVGFTSIGSSHWKRTFHSQGFNGPSPPLFRFFIYNNYIKQLYRIKLLPNPFFTTFKQPRIQNVSISHQR